MNLFIQLRYNEFMRIEIDQSGKLEDTHKPTVVSFSNSKNKTIIIFSTEKQKLQKYFRKINKRKIYVYMTFAFLIFSLIKNEKKIEEITIDKEYVGQEPLIKNYLINFIKQKRPIDKRSINFKEITKKSNAHKIALKAYTSKRADLKIGASTVIKFLQNKRPGV